MFGPKDRAATRLVVAGATLLEIDLGVILYHNWKNNPILIAASGVHYVFLLITLGCFRNVQTRRLIDPRPMSEFDWLMIGAPGTLSFLGLFFGVFGGFNLFFPGVIKELK